ncbi:hypothetical protein WP1_031 [Pseudomonas phage WP1]
MVATPPAGIDDIAHHCEDRAGRGLDPRPGGNAGLAAAGDLNSIAKRLTDQNRARSPSRHRSRPGTFRMKRSG